MTYSGVTGSGGSPDPVDVTGEGLRELVVDDILEPLDVKAPRGEVCGKHDVVFAELEFFEGVEPLGLGKIAVELAYPLALEPEDDCETVALSLGLGEDEHSLLEKGVQEVD